MNSFERLYRVVLETLIFLTSILFMYVVGGQTFNKVYLIYGFLTAHTLTWLFNGQFVTMLIHMNLIPNSPIRFLTYTDRLHARIQSKSYIRGAAVYGSLTRIEFRKTSDLDLRVIMKPGLLHRIRICHFSFLERLKACFFIFPIDIFAFELNELIYKMSSDENPILFSDPSGILAETYPRALSYEEFRVRFSSKFL
jgi:predicted nucleotidyltransferase